MTHISMFEMTLYTIRTRIIIVESKICIISPKSCFETNAECRCWCNAPDSSGFTATYEESADWALISFCDDSSLHISIFK